MNYHNLKRFYFKELIKEEYIIIENQDFLHAKNVIRLKVGDKIIGICNDGYDYLSSIIEIGKKEIKCKVEEKIKNLAEPNFNITIYQALLKGEKMELVVQKCTELGASKFVPFTSEYCQIKASTTRIDRLEKITQESAKQCKRSNSMSINSVLSFKEMLYSLKGYDKIILAYELENEKHFNPEILSNSKNVAIIIGSEGGFSPNEIDELVQSGAVVVSLGTRILRAETASIHLCGLVSNYLEGKNEFLYKKNGLQG